jgi:hypothetical protein
MDRKPGDYAVGTPESRAAARAMLEAKRADRKRVDIVCSIPRPGAEDAIHIGKWIENPDGSLFRFSNVPAGMTIAEAERIVSQPGLASHFVIK